MDLDLKGRTALVTGASSGIGRGIALALGREGARVAITARRKDLLEELADAIVAASGPRPVVITCDLLDADAPKRISSAALQTLGPIDILVNNAGGSRKFTLTSSDDELR